MPYLIDQTHTATSKGQRIRFLVLHYTAVNLEQSLQLLTQGEVSTHYLIPEEPGIVYQLVKEQEQAHHAGQSVWQNRSNLNDTSLGIELVNLGFQNTEKERLWLPFNTHQIETLIELAQDIIHRYHIPATAVVGHSDIAPGRKMDPGPLFPWQRLSHHGIGAWPDSEEVEKALPLFTNKAADILWIQQNLKKYGYAIEETSRWDSQTQTVLQAFQQHFRPERCSGEPDAQTCAILASLIKKYF